MTNPQSSHPFAASEAAMMLTAGLRLLREERGISLRNVASSMGLKQATSLSHMAVGRIPIPVDRAEELAERLHLDRVAFLQAVLGQRYPNVNWKTSLISDDALGDAETTESWRQIFGNNSAQLSSEKISIIREIVKDRWPRDRWLAEEEVPLVALIRHLRPEWCNSGVSFDDEDAIRKALGR